MQISEPPHENPSMQEGLPNPVLPTLHVAELNQYSTQHNQSFDNIFEEIYLENSIVHHLRSGIDLHQ